MDGLHPKQRAAAEDKSRFKAALCGRRSGKTWGIACQLLETAEKNPDEMSVYIALTKAQARRNLGAALLRIKKAFGINGRLGEQDGQLHWIHHNGHRIWLAGCKHLTEAEKFRGDYYCEAVIDEGASYPMGLLDYMVREALHWALVDKAAPLTIVGTPGALPIGFFHDVTVGTAEMPAWPTHMWTMFDNPAIKDAQGELELRMKHTGESQDSPSIQREVFAKWARDESAIIYPYVASRNACWDIPKDCDRWVLSLDLGYDDDTTFTIAGSKRGTGKVWFLKSYGIVEMTTSQRAAEVRRNEIFLREFTGDPNARFSSIVVDEGGGGKSISKDMSRDYGINCRPAEKAAKASAIRNLQDALRSGRALIHPGNCSQLIGEWGILPWDKTRTNHHEEFADHCSDGALYNYREHPTMERWEHEPPTPGTPEAINAEAAKYKKELAEKMKTAKNPRMSPAQKRARLKRMARA